MNISLINSWADCKYACRTSAVQTLSPKIEAMGSRSRTDTGWRVSEELTMKCFELIQMSTDHVTGPKLHLIFIGRLDGQDETTWQYVGIIRDTFSKDHLEGSSHQQVSHSSLLRGCNLFRTASRITRHENPCKNMSSSFSEEKSDRQCRMSFMNGYVCSGVRYGFTLVTLKRSGITIFRVLDK